MGRNILVIKLGALGDFVQAVGPMNAIRNHHPDDRITLMTRPAYAEFGMATGLFDDVLIDHEPRIFQPGMLLALRHQLRNGGFERVYDLQTSDRSSFYYRLFWPGPYPEWSGIVPMGSHYHHYSRPTMQHNFDRQSDQLRIAGIDDVALSDLSGIKADLTPLDLPARYALLVPASSDSPTAARKRWPLNRYADVANWLTGQQITPLLIGGPDAAKAASKVQNLCPIAIDLTGKTSLIELSALAADARLTIGGDTGPTHLAAYAGCPTIALFSTETLPQKAAPRGDRVEVLIRDDLNDLHVDDVTGVAEDLLKPDQD